jgi:hypothetical protein
MNELNYAIDNDEIKPKRKHPSPSVRHSLYSLYLPSRVNHAEEISKNMESDTDAENEINKNAGIMNRGAGTFYMLSTFVVFVILSLTVLKEDGLSDWPRVFTYLHCAHGLLTLYSLHWRKGSVVEADQGEYDDLTWWEQLDGGHAWTNSKRFLTLVPVVLFFAAMHALRDSQDYFSLMYPNVVIFVVSLVAKMPFMHRVRAFGINTTKYD